MSFPADVLYEVIDGRIVEKNDVGAYGSELASNLLIFLAPFVREAKIGRLLSETLFRISDRRDRRPDLSFVSFQRWAKDAPAPDTHAWNVIPDLMVEVVSRTDAAWDVLAKVHQYFEAGARSVWLIYPNLSVVHVFDSMTLIRVLTRADDLDGGDVIPGFRLPLAQLFYGEPEPEGEAGTPTV